MVRFEQEIPHFPATARILVDGRVDSEGQVRNEQEAAAALRSACQLARNTLCLPGRYDGVPVEGLYIVEFPDPPVINAEDPEDNRARQVAHCDAEWSRKFEQHRSSIDRARIALYRLGDPQWDTYEPQIVRDAT